MWIDELMDHLEDMRNDVGMTGHLQDILSVFRDLGLLNNNDNQEKHHYSFSEKDIL